MKVDKWGKICTSTRLPYSYLNLRRHKVREIKTEQKVIHTKYTFEILIVLKYAQNRIL